MGKLKHLIIHCTDTPLEREVSKADLMQWHMSPKPKGRGWDRLGYSDIIHINGGLENLTPYNEDDFITSHEMTWGAAGVNSVSRHIVVVGGRTKDNKRTMFDFMTKEQLHALLNYCRQFIDMHPNCTIAGHYYFSKFKTCPNFDVEALLLNNDFPKKNIYHDENKTTPFDIIVTPNN